MSSKRKVLATIMEKAWNDKEFRTALKADPKGVMRANGLELPTGVDVVIHHNTSFAIHLVLPLED